MVTTLKEQVSVEIQLIRNIYRQPWSIVGLSPCHSQAEFWKCDFFLHHQPRYIGPCSSLIPLRLLAEHQFGRQGSAFQNPKPSRGQQDEISAYTLPGMEYHTFLCSSLLHTKLAKKWGGGGGIFFWHVLKSGKIRCIHTSPKSTSKTTTTTKKGKDISRSLYLPHRDTAVNPFFHWNNLG